MLALQPDREVSGLEMNLNLHPVRKQRVPSRLQVPVILRMFRMCVQSLV